ncbi:hypothetical protein MTR_4g063795 [Medicago truncatula]|uniref:Uncharacterized protein n=1 Tax=Medicago truncatula TaxID=3880 RepID=A0A072UKA4_MEDTR|nr:hypothetical protein MTR_4g063795 [Medicago truncatula]
MVDLQLMQHLLPFHLIKEAAFHHSRLNNDDLLFDAKELLRPLDGAVEPKNLAEMSKNCNIRYLRFTPV